MVNKLLKLQVKFVFYKLRYHITSEVSDFLVYFYGFVSSIIPECIPCPCERFLFGLLEWA
jgi:hypothetical protein